MDYPLDVNRILKAFRIANGPHMNTAEKMITAVIPLVNKAYEDGYKAGLAASERKKTICLRSQT